MEILCNYTVTSIETNDNSDGESRTIKFFLKVKNGSDDQCNLTISIDDCRCGTSAYFVGVKKSMMKLIGKTITDIYSQDTKNEIIIKCFCEEYPVYLHEYHSCTCKFIYAYTKLSLTISVEQNKNFIRTNLLCPEEYNGLLLRPTFIYNMTFTKKHLKS